MAKSDAPRSRTGSVLRADRDAHIISCSWWTSSRTRRQWRSSNRAETGEFATFPSGLSDSPLTFRNLDVLREDEL